MVLSERTPEVLFRVGQVVRHKMYGYRGVVFEWDPVATVEEQWIQQMGVGAEWGTIKLSS